tara:strand:+ start:1419 stop:2129 length:711 start_codon:yes stop_codon:yes gene_type:complete
MLGLGNSLTGGNVSEVEFVTPADLPGIIHWYKHDTGLEESDTSTPENGEDVTKWADQIGSEHLVGTSNLPTYTSATGTLNFGTNSANVLTITSGTSSDITLDGDFAIYVRIKFAGTPNTTDIFFKDDDSLNNFFRANSATLIRAKITSGSLNWTVPTMGTSAFYNIGIERTGGGNNTRVYLDGTESSTGALAVPNDWLIDTLKGGKADEFSTLIIVKGSALSTTHRAALQTYLAAL